ncbi:hypothetical protein AAFF_G00272810 [Aldrovandia affinis]|uniref:Muscarinic acetylcholine receptor n=1 Tax=Aldrovandia affinis TaxID=143900 RepID=A0AAD7RB81_9TELE|nr:hypothetical protein AAFF_G00272810 [Aldrovandia affinis]
MNVSCDPPASNWTLDPLGGHKPWEVALIIVITGLLSLVTVVGNLLVMISFRVNSHLRTVSNYFLLSLAVADLVLGAVSMNLYTTYVIMGRWALGSLACDVWLAIDYVVSNASVLSLLLICLDRFLSVTRPLTYRAKRTRRRAALLIGLAWAVSFLLWGPATLLWPYMAAGGAERQGAERLKCSIQFLAEPAFTFGTATAAFYLPATVMVVLYWRIYRETERRRRDLPGLLGLADGTGGAAMDSGAAKSSVSSSLRGARDGRGSPGGEGRGLGGEGRGPGCFPARAAEGNASPVAVAGTPTRKRPWTRRRPRRRRRRGGGETAGRVAMVRLRDAHEASPRGSQDRGASPPGTPAQQPRGKKRRSVGVRKGARGERKAAKTLSAILLAFIVTWTPYNIMVLVSIFCCVPETLWQLGYWLCYVNSTVNPVCYALCNKSFRVTFKMLLLLRWDKRKWDPPHRGATMRPCNSSSAI